MAMICMVKHNPPPIPIAPPTNSTTGAEPKCTYDNGNVTARSYKGQFEWTGSQQSYIFTAFYFGGLISVIPGAYLCTKYGSKKVVFWGAILNVLGTFLTPSTAIYFGPYAVIGIRVMMGLGQGILVPCMNVLIADWFPVNEKSMAVAIATTGNQISVITALFLTAELCQFQLFGGWKAAFYVYAIVGSFFCMLWWIFIIDSPEKDKHITEAELHFINTHKPRTDNGHRKDAVVPWKRILSSGPVLAAALNSFAQNFFNVGLVTYIPQYYRTVLRANLSSNGIMSALPFIIQLVTKIGCATSADYLKRNKMYSNTSVVKMYNLVGSIGGAICILCVTVFDCDHKFMAVGLIISSVGISSGYIPGYNTSIVCIAPFYTASVGSYCRVWAQVASVLAPFTIGILVKSGNPSDWNTVFYILSFIMMVCGIHFQCYGSSSPQGWAKVQESEEKNEAICLGMSAPIVEKEGSEVGEDRTELIINDEMRKL
uniref:MFS domain-containing protein n=1 Tax=Rhabditophanes sp. KR3021 TaxID=114890 RepID=A0AC35U0F3_9BILA